MLNLLKIEIGFMDSRTRVLDTGTMIPSHILIKVVPEDVYLLTLWWSSLDCSCYFQISQVVYIYCYTSIQIFLNLGSSLPKLV